MKLKSILISLITVIFIAAIIFLLQKKAPIDDNHFIFYVVNPTKQNLQFYWKNDSNDNFGSLGNLNIWLSKKNKKVLFAMNAGMYKQDHSPQGLYIENSKPLSALDTSSGNGNFYLKPNGIFYITKNNAAVICNTTNFIHDGTIKFATQSGPMLMVDGQIHAAFIKGSTNLQIRNGVGILPNNEVLFAMSKKEINLYDFANFFKKLGCKNALYLDGFVSRTYLPEKNWIQTDGHFAVMIAVTDYLQK